MYRTVPLEKKKERKKGKKSYRFRITGFRVSGISSLRPALTQDQRILNISTPMKPGTSLNNEMTIGIGPGKRQEYYHEPKKRKSSEHPS